MDSFEFFDNKEFTKKWKGKAGVYIIENPLFTRFVGFPVYKVGYARKNWTAGNVLSVCKEKTRNAGKWQVFGQLGMYCRFAKKKPVTPENGKDLDN